MGLLDLSPEDQQALMAMGFAMMGTPKGQGWQRLGRAGLLGMATRQNYLDRQQEGKMRELAVQEHQVKLDAARQAQEAAAAERAGLGKIFGGPSLGNMGPGGPTPANAAAVAPNRVQQYRDAAAYYAARGNHEAAKRFSDIAGSMEEEYSTTPQTLMQGDKPVSALIGKRGNTKVLEGLGPKPDYKEINTGARTLLFDPLSKTTAGEFKQEVAPNTIYSGNITMRGQNMTDARMREQNSIAAGGKANDMVANLRKEFNALDEVKNYKAAAPMLRSASNAPNTPAGDLDVIYAVGKALDPNSVVREGELNLVIKSGSVMDRFRGAANYLKGGGRLPPSQRADLMKMLEGRVGELHGAYQSSRAAYERTADQMGLPKEQIFTEIDAPKSGPVKIAGDDDFAKLPSGALFVGPDGKTRRKP